MKSQKQGSNRLAGTLICGIDSDTCRRPNIRAMVQLCGELDTLLIAEAVETAAEAQTLRKLGVRYHQGY